MDSRIARIAVLMFASATSGVSAQAPKAQAAPAPPFADAERVRASVARCVEFLLGAQEGEEKAEWPYEGVYRVGGKIPIGYRIGGTSIAATALLRAPGYEADADRQTAVARALAFVVRSLDDGLMSPDYNGGYDVRGWGYTYGLDFMLALKSTGAAAALPEATRNKLDDKVRWCIAAAQQTEIPEAGGWNYARAAGKGKVSPPSPFMTGPTLLALFEARKQGFNVDAAVVERGLRALERGRSPTGSVSYAGDADKRPEAVPGAVGRMLVCEVTLALASRSDVLHVRAALDAFLVHWEWLDDRRAKSGTHEGPYKVAPYYFYYAHAMAARAIEMLPPGDRAEYRRRLYDRLFSVRLDNGTWNDRVFERTANYGTSQALMCFLAPALPCPTGWEAAKAEKQPE